MPSRRAEVTYIGKTENRKDNEAGERIFRVVAICCFFLSVVLDSVAPATSSPDQHGLQACPHNVPASLAASPAFTECVYAYMYIYK